MDAIEAVVRLFWVGAIANATTPLSLRLVLLCASKQLLRFADVSHGLIIWASMALVTVQYELLEFRSRIPDHTLCDVAILYAVVAAAFPA